jgi:predicted metal-binding membrane protein
MAQPLSETARERLAARARRLARIRRRVFAATIAAFALAWAVIAWNGSMGAPTTTASTGSNTTSSADAATASSSGGCTSSSDNGTSSSSDGNSAGAVTTSQS